MIFSTINRALLIALVLAVLLLGASGYYLKVQIGKVGELEVQLGQAVEHNRQWQDLMDEIGKHGRLLESLDQRLNEADSRSRERLSQFERGLRDAINELQVVREWAGTVVPEPVADLMCEQGHIAPAIRVRHCAGAVPD